MPQTAPAPATPVTLPHLLKTLHTPDEHATINLQSKGMTGLSTRHTLSHEATLDGIDLASTHVWYGLNPIRAGILTGRGKASDITRLAALPIDIDVKPGACESMPHGYNLVKTLTDILGTPPRFTVYSGGGLQPIWPLDPTDPDTHLDTPVKAAHAATVLKAWGDFVKRTAGRQNIHLDSIFDLPRILRAPGTNNVKLQELRPTFATEDTNNVPLTLAELEDLLAEHHVELQPAPTLNIDAVPVSTWTHAKTTCHYIDKMLTGWASDMPDERHPWLVRQALKLAAAHRYGCLTEADHREALELLETCFMQQLAGGSNSRPYNAQEFRDAISSGVQKTTGLSDLALRRTLGDHIHLDAMLDALPVKTPSLAPAKGATTETDISDAAEASDTVGEVPNEPAEPTPTTTRFTFTPPNHALLRPGFTFTGDDNNAALAFADLYQPQLRYLTDQKTWTTWNGNTWQQNDAAAAIHARSYAYHYPHNEKHLSKTRERLQSTSGLDALCRLATKDPTLHMTTQQFDTNPYLLNTPTGPVNLRTGQIQPPDPSHYLTRCTNTTPDPTMPTPKWDQFLATTFAGQPELTKHIQTLLGLSIIGTVLEQILPFCYGAGANGKSTLVAVAQKLLGLGNTGYAATSPSSLLTVQRNEPHPTVIARLRGARFVVSSEIEEGQRFAEAQIKSLTGKDILTGRFMHQDFFDFEPSHTMWLLANTQPAVRAGGGAFWRRVQLINFANVVPADERIADLEEQLVEEEGPGILAWIIQGAANYLQHGMQIPECVQKESEEYRKQEDTVAQFVESRCVLLPAVSTRSGAIWHEYEAWCASEGVRPVGRKTFAQSLQRDHHVAVVRKKHGIEYIGIGLEVSDHQESLERGDWGAF